MAEEIKNLNIYKAILAFQSECPLITKDAVNPFFKSKYAPLDAIWKVIHPILKKHGLIVTQPVHEGRVITAVIHAESGESISGSFPMVAKDQTPQSYGSAVSYARRYGLCSLLSLQTGEDDDGNEATKPVDNKKSDEGDW